MAEVVQEAFPEEYSTDVMVYYTYHYNAGGMNEVSTTGSTRAREMEEVKKGAGARLVRE